jgi:hypothetical protein
MKQIQYENPKQNLQGDELKHITDKLTCNNGMILVILPQHHNLVFMLSHAYKNFRLVNDLQYSLVNI